MQCEVHEIIKINTDALKYISMSHFMNIRVENVQSKHFKRSEKKLNLGLISFYLYVHNFVLFLSFNFLLHDVDYNIELVAVFRIVTTYEIFTQTFFFHIFYE